MGLDKFTHFILKAINNNGCEELYIDNNIRKIVANYIIFDINFLIYQEIIEIENEINNIIKIILCLSLSFEKKEIIKKSLEKIFSQKYWESYIKYNELIEMIDITTDNIIINQFLTDLNTSNKNNITLIELIIYNKIIFIIINNINNYHIINFIQNISIFFDGIPSISKVIEQRRRRIKNYLETTNKKKLYKILHENLLNSCESINIDNELIYYDYNKWYSNKFIIDKSLGPASNFILNCEEYIKNKLEFIYPKINIYINSSSENGEADLKIFKYIYLNDIIGDYCIHTIDSDFIFLLLVQQIYYNILNREINISIFKYIKNNLMQILDGNLIIKSIMNLYNELNNVKSNNYKIIWDICFLFYFFGNDHLPSSIEITTELDLDFFLKIHYQTLNKNNIINYNTNITINLQNLSLYLQKINNTRDINITKIILKRFFKINNQLINLFINKFNLNFNEILLFLNKFIILQKNNLSEEDYNNLDEDDLRKKINNNFILNNNIFLINNDKINFIISNLDNDIIKLIEENIDYELNEEYNGLILYSKPYNILFNKYQDLNNYINDKTMNNLNKQYPQFYNNNDINEYLNQFNIINTLDSEEYLKKIYHLTITQFAQMDNIHSDNITFYKGYNVPSLNNIILFLDNLSDTNNIIKLWTNQISDDNIDKEKYLNSNNHYLLISPFNNNLHLPKDINFENINNLWIDNINDFKYRNINIKDFFDCW